MAKLLQDISIGNNLQRLRKSKRLTQNDVCAQMASFGRPMLQSTYAQIETGARNIFISDFIVLRRVFNVPFEEFFKGLEPVNKYEQESE